MREILFRGKLLSTNEWAEGNLAVSKTGVTIITPDDTPVGKYGQVDPEMVGQFTGIYDKNGKKIFEGDILLYLEKWRREVVWSDDRKGFYTREFNSPVYDWVCIGDLWRFDTEVIGNIHDNPELLER